MGILQIEPLKAVVSLCCTFNTTNLLYFQEKQTKQRQQNINFDTKEATLRFYLAKNV